MNRVNRNPGDVIWVRFTWDLRDLSSISPAPAGYQFRSAEPQEVEDILKTVIEAYQTDPVWKPSLADIEKRMTERILTSFGKPETAYIIALILGHIVAASGVAKSHWTDQNLLTGICVQADHQRKGLGRYMLGLSLQRLREMDLAEARVYTRAGSLADRKLYPLFGSRREEGVEYPALRSDLPLT